MNRKIKFKDENNNLNRIKNPFKKFDKKDFIIFIIILILDFLQGLIYNLFEMKLNFIFISQFSVQMIFISLYSKLYSNSRYYIHQFISHLIFTILCIIIDIITIKLKVYKFEIIFLMLYFICLLNYSIVISYEKYLFEIKFFSPKEASFIFGTSKFLFFIILIISEHFFGKGFCFKGECNDIIMKIDNWLVIFISFILTSIQFFFIYQCLFDFTPNHIFFIEIFFLFFSLINDYIKKEDQIVISYFIIDIFCFFLLLI